MPPIVRTPHRLGQLSSITLKSVYSASDVAPSSDAFHPERWSNPPPVGVDPIIPCDEPEEDEDVAIYVRSNPPSAPPTDERTAPSATVVRVPATTRADEEVHQVAVDAAQVVPAEEHASEPPPPAEVAEVDAVTVRRPDPVPDEPVRLPFGEKRSESEQRLLLMAAFASGATLLAGVAAALLWL
jgi:hypothetical protein